MARTRAPLTSDELELATVLGRIAATHGGVITAAQARAVGVVPGGLRPLLAAGLLRRLRRGVYADVALLGSTEVVQYARECAALLAVLRGDAVVSHLSAARILGLPMPPWYDRRISVTRRPPAPGNDPLRADTHVASYDDDDVIERYGIPVLGGARLVLDCCAVAPPESALAIADAALATGLTDLPALQQALPLVPLARARLAYLVVERADPLAESWFESSSRWWLLEGGIPRPKLQVRWFDGDGRLRARTDMLVEPWQTVGEADGLGKYATIADLRAEKAREDWLRSTQRLEVVRFVPQEFRTAAGRQGVVRRFLEAADRAAARRAG